MIPRLVLVGMMLWVGLAFGADLQGLLPDPDKTPGVADPALTAEVLCAKKFTTRDVRSVTAAMKREVFQSYGISCGKGKKPCGLWEIDHEISLELGGANVKENLWPQKYQGVWGARIKDRLENKLHALVCAGEIDLATAQQEISTDWIAAYKRRMRP